MKNNLGNQSDERIPQEEESRPPICIKKPDKMENHQEKSKSIEERNKRLVEELAELVTKESYLYEQLKNTL